MIAELRATSERLKLYAIPEGHGVVSTTTLATADELRSELSGESGQMKAFVLREITEGMAVSIDSDGIEYMAGALTAFFGAVL